MPLSFNRKTKRLGYFKLFNVINVNLYHVEHGESVHAGKEDGCAEGVVSICRAIDLCPSVVQPRTLIKIVRLNLSAT